MPTLLFCTAYAPTRHLWEARYRRWLDAVLVGGFGAQQILIVDDASPVRPDWPDVQVVAIDDTDEAIACDAPIVLAHFADRLGKGVAHVFPGWFRSLGFVARFAQARGFDRIVHIESDAFVLTERMRDWLRRPESGWHSTWCPKYQMPELAIMKIGADRIASFAQFARQPYANLAGRVHEALVPITHVNRDFHGDRFGETAGFVPRDADFATQIPPQRETSYYWWTQLPAERSVAAQIFTFENGGNGAPLLQSGWRHADAAAAMTGAWSSLKLPAFAWSQRGDVSLVFKFVTSSGAQDTLVVTLDGVFLVRFDIDANAIVGVDLPARTDARDSANILTFVRTDDAGRPIASGAEAKLLGLAQLLMTAR